MSGCWHVAQATLTRKHEVQVLICRTSLQPLRGLPLLMRLKRLNECRREFHTPAAPRRLGFLEAPALAPPNQGTANACGRGLEVYVLPLQRKVFLWAHARGQGQQKERIPRVLLGGLEEAFRLLGRHRLHFAPLLPW